MSPGYLSGIVQRARTAPAAPASRSPVRTPRHAVSPHSAALASLAEPRRAAPVATPMAGGAPPPAATGRQTRTPATALALAPTRMPDRVDPSIPARVARAGPVAPQLPSQRVGPPAPEPPRRAQSVTVAGPRHEHEQPAALAVAAESGDPASGPGKDVPQRRPPGRSPRFSAPAAGTSERAMAAAAVAPVPEAGPAVRDEAPRSTTPDATATRGTRGAITPTFHIRLPEEARGLEPAVRLEVERAVRRASRAELERRAASAPPSAGSGPVEITVGHVTVEVNAAPPPAVARPAPAPAATAASPAGDGGFASLFLARNLSSW
jgi:hypothetical protein